MPPTFGTRRPALPFAWAAFLAIALSASLARAASVERGPDGALVYERDDQGNRVPDFSSCGYAGADRAIPDVPARMLVEPSEGDDRARIQAAIDEVAALPANADGFRGAVLLAPGRFEVAGSLRIEASGVVLRGSGAVEGGTIIVATGTDRRTLIRIVGVARKQGLPHPGPLPGEERVRVVDEYVPVGATRLTLASTAGLKVGDAVLVTRPSTVEWIKALGMDAFGLGWRPGSRDLRWDRRITAIDGDAITLDAPITTAIEAKYGGATVAKYEWPGRIERVGVEDLRLVSAFDGKHPHDEEHAWFGVTLENVRDAWVRRVAFRRFAGGAVAAWETASRVTVEDCRSQAPVSEVAGYRRRAFFTQGQQTLFLRCWSARGRNDFAAGHCAAGPNAFVNCEASQTTGDSGPLEGWAAGVLYDNVRIEGGGLVLDNRWTAPPQAGWSAANCVLWQCQAATIRCFRPLTANNWALGVWAMFAGDGVFEARSDFVSPLSLYQAQLAERVGDEAAQRVGPFLLKPESSTNPTLEEARGFVGRSDAAGRRLVEVIEERMRNAGESIKNAPAPSPFEGRAGEGGEAGTNLGPGTRGLTRPLAPPPQGEGNGLEVKNGWLTIDGRVLTGGRVDPKWWAGNTRPDEAPAFGPSITRFVPGRVGTGFTDDLEQVADAMVARGDAAYDHHYGLWYDLRRADHLIVRQADASCSPPFYEQPFARTGRGRAWDGLSKYDLTKFNPWYWQRLGDFAALCDERGLVLLHQNYFQHNILEAGAHWVDSPWRPVNNVNDTGFPEPPPFIGDKRIFLAHQFYDVTHPRRRELHRAYIRQCLDNFAGASNVIQMTSAEYSGPLEFTQFWLDVIAEWQAEHGRDVLVALSAPKDVQDAILADPARAKLVDVIDIRYWCYGTGGELYAPAGGQSLAPRQHLRQTRLRPAGFAEIARAVHEYRTMYPDKAVTYFAEQNCPSRRDGWAVLMGGGSLADVPRLPAELLEAIAGMKPVDGVIDGGDAWSLSSEDGDVLIYSEQKNVEIAFPTGRGYRVRWIDPRTADTIDNSESGAARFEMKQKLLWLSPR
jgi:hypothetical protein